MRIFSLVATVSGCYRLGPDVPAPDFTNFSENSHWRCTAQRKTQATYENGRLKFLPTSKPPKYGGITAHSDPPRQAGLLPHPAMRSVSSQPFP